MTFQPRHAIVTASDSGIGRASAVALAASGLDEVAGRLGGVDVFVNNAGTGSATLALDMPLEQWRHVVATDLDAAFACLQQAARRMVRAGQGGRLIAVTSVHEHQPRVGRRRNASDGAAGRLAPAERRLAERLT